MVGSTDGEGTPGKVCTVLAGDGCRVWLSNVPLGISWTGVKLGRPPLGVRGIGWRKGGGSLVHEEANAGRAH